MKSETGDPNSDISLLEAEIEAINDARQWELIFKSGLEGAVANSERKLKMYYNIVARKREQIKMIQEHIKKKESEG